MERNHHPVHTLKAEQPVFLSVLGGCASNPREFVLNAAATVLVESEVLKLKSGACITTVLHVICLVDKQSSLS